MANPELFLVEERLKTFKSWPFSDKDQCNARSMAEAGFYSVATGEDDADAAKCFLCGKELDGWESTDDPWAEHKGHAAQCAFVQLGKKEDDLLLSEFLSITLQYTKNLCKTETERAKQRLDEKLKRVKRRVQHSSKG